MKRRDKYHPDYKNQYPGEHISPEVMATLKQSDRKMEYMEVDLKQERFRQDLKAMKAEFIPSREDSYERLKDECNAVFLLDEPTPEERVVHNDELERLCKALEMLEPEERALVYSLFYDQISEESLAERAGVTQQAVSKKLRKIYKKIRRLMRS